jgi:hypothetical protein
VSKSPPDPSMLAPPCSLMPDHHFQRI